jgi:hypothetical protein
MYIVFSPDGFPIHWEDTYKTKKKAEQALDDWSKRYERQGYYSSVDYGRIPLNELKQYCEIQKIN